MCPNYKMTDQCFLVGVFFPCGSINRSLPFSACDQNRCILKFLDQHDSYHVWRQYMRVFRLLLATHAELRRSGKGSPIVIHLPMHSGYWRNHVHAYVLPESLSLRSQILRVWLSLHAESSSLQSNAQYHVIQGRICHLR